MTHTPTPRHDFFSWADHDPQRVAITMAGTGKRYSAGTVAQRARSMAQWLAQQGLQVGETFVVLLENRVEVLELVLAARLAGVYAVVLSTHLSAAEIAYIVTDCAPRLIVGSRRTWPLLQDTGGPETVARWSVEEPHADENGALSLVAALNEVEGRAPEIDFSDRPLGRDLLYSSGTTGRPKGVVKPLMPNRYRHELAPDTQVTAHHFFLDERTVYLSPAPLYHAAPLRYTMRALDMGGQAVIMERFDAQEALALIERYQVTHSQWVPTMFRRLLQLPASVRQQYDLGSHRVAIHAAAPCPVPLKQAMLDWWGDILFEYYAGSEGCGTTLITSAEWRQRPGSVGRAISGQIHVLDDDGVELPAGQIGNVYFSGGGQFVYLNDEEKTRRAINDSGWATYGDVGHVDAGGYLYLSDRRADLILSGGVNLYPQEIENALRQHPAVSELAVVGVPHPDYGEQPLAAVVLNLDVQPSPALAQDIVAQAAQALGHIKLPQRVVFVDALPRLATGKLLRRKLKESYRQDPQAGYAISRDGGSAADQPQGEKPA